MAELIWEQKSRRLYNYFLHHYYFLLKVWKQLKLKRFLSLKMSNYVLVNEKCLSNHEFIIGDDDRNLEKQDLIFQFGIMKLYNDSK